MLPNQLTPGSFTAYPPEAQRLAASRIALLQRLPLGFVPLLLRELIVYDWKFPAERKDIERQFAYLSSLAPAELAQSLASFSQLRLTAALEQVDWVNSPAVFSEQLTAHLWATHQIDAFRAAAIEYVAKSSEALPDGPLPVHRLGIAIIGQGVQSSGYRLFRKLRSQGMYFTQVRHANGLDTLTGLVAKRAAEHPAAYGHWYIDGGMPAGAHKGVAAVSYAALSPARAALQNRMQKIYEAKVFDPEAFRTTLAQTRLEEVGLSAGGDGVLSRFQLSLLTEGSGTQIFATTFVQWAAREALRRAQPLSLLARFAPRQHEKPMNELLGEAQRPPEADPEGSLVDGDMGAYYTWLNLQRLPGASDAAFLVWFEDHGEAVAIGRGFARGKQQDNPIELAELARQLA